MIEVWGDMPTEIQEALFEVAIRGRPDLAKLLHDRHPRPIIIECRRLFGGLFLLVVRTNANAAVGCPVPALIAVVVAPTRG